MASSVDIGTTVSFKSSGEIDLADLKEFIAACEAKGLPDNVAIKVNAGNAQRDGQWLHLTATEGANVGGSRG